MPPKTKFDDVLSDTEKLAIQMFVDNEVQVRAVKKILLFGIYNNGTLKKDLTPDPLQNFAFRLVSRGMNLTNEVLGQQNRAEWEGINALENAFNELLQFKKNDERSEPKGNPAR